MPRAITAAWLVLPPWLVRMPSAATMPFRSSGLVSQRTSTHLRAGLGGGHGVGGGEDGLAHRGAGEAFRPRATTS